MEYFWDLEQNKTSMKVTFGSGKFLMSNQKHISRLMDNGKKNVLLNVP